MLKYVAAVTAAIVCALTLAQGASAQTSPARLTQVVPLTGTAKHGAKFTGKYTIDRFVARGGKLYSVGTLTGKLRGKRVTKENVRLPASVGDGSARASQVPLPPLPPGNACAVLSLDLGPVNLNLLGLVVRTNQIQLRIDAVQGAGNLLGNLLCGITGILNPSALSSTPLGQLAQVLNALLALSPRTG
jgi:hypothetical protein